MKKVFSVLLCLIILSGLAACGEPAEKTVSFEAMDTLMSLKIRGGGDISEQIEQRARELDAVLSTTDPESEIFRLNRNGSAALGEDALDLVKRSLELSRDLRGYFDPTVYPAVCEWGFISGDHHVPDETRLRELAEHIDSTAVRIDGDTVTLPEGAQIDLGAAAKGYLADECRAILSESKSSCAILNLGGTILLYGKKPDGSPFRVGVADPDNPAGYFGYLSCGEGVAATSGGYERYFEKDGKTYIHILDPTTAKPVDNGVLSVTVFSADGVRADALSTALFVMGVDKATEYYQTRDGFDFILLTDDDTLYLTEGIADDFTLADGYDFDIISIKKTPSGQGSSQSG